jgi:hypothetical protein
MFCRKALGLGLFALMAAVLAAHELPREVLVHPRPGDVLGSRAEWALREAGAKGYKSGFWVGYDIRRLMGEHSFIGSWNDDHGSAGPTLEEILTGRKRPESLVPRAERLRRTAKEVLDDLENDWKPEKKVWKSVAILLRYGVGTWSQAGPDKVEMSNFELNFDFQGLPLLWLGDASDDQSLTLLRGLYAGAKREETKKHVLAAVGVHNTPALVIPILESVLASRDADELRKDAAFWIGQQDDAAALKVLRQAARTDRSCEVQKGAVFAISQVELEAAVDELIDLARTAENENIRHEAVFWLGQRASKKAGAALIDFATKDGDSRVQEQAVFALSQLPENQGVEPLIKIARTHPNPHVRKKAVFWLGECHDPRALEALIAIVKGK